jgi:hypothetical protein
MDGTDLMNEFMGETEVNRLRQALLATAVAKQFGPCWCDTADGLYCVGQKQCRNAQRALGANSSALMAEFKAAVKAVEKQG